MPNPPITKDRWKEAQAHEDEFWARRADMDEQWVRVRRYAGAAAKVDELIAEDAQVLDVGSGPTAPTGLLQKGIKFALDPLMVTYANVKDHTLPRGPQGLVRAVAAMGERIPLPDNSIDCCFCTNALDHTLWPMDVLADIRRVLKPKAIFLCGMFVRPGFYVHARHALERASPRFREIPHPYRYTLWMVRRMLTEAGFELLEDHRVGRKARVQWIRRSDWVFIARNRK